nr:DUF4244 domain-containing protein [Actinoplanes lichenis]
MHRLIAQLVGPLGADDGSHTVEYAVGTLAAAGFGTVLYKVVQSTSITTQLTKLISEALN